MVDRANEVTWKPFKGRWYYAKFQRVKAQASIKMPSVADLTDQDLRDTAVTWLAMAEVDIPGICAITGHQLASATLVLRHYLDLNSEIADAAMHKMVAWYESSINKNAM